MEPLYTAETRSQIERVLSVFRDYIVTTNYFDILYSKKVGYVYFDINPKRMKVAENNCFVIENGEQLARRLAYDMAIDIMEEVGHCLDPHEATPLEQAEIKKRELRPGVKFCVSDIRQSQEWHWKAGRILA